MVDECIESVCQVVREMTDGDFKSLEVNQVFSFGNLNQHFLILFKLIILVFQEHMLYEKKIETRGAEVTFPQVEEDDGESAVADELHATASIAEVQQPLGKFDSLSIGGQSEQSEILGFFKVPL